MRLAKLALLFGLPVVAMEVGCGEAAGLIVIGSGGAFASGGSGTGGGRPVRPKGDLGGDLNIAIGDGSGGVPAGTGGSDPIKPGDGTLRICQTGDGPSIGNPEGSLLLDDFESLENGYSGNGLRGSWFVYEDESSGTQFPFDSSDLPVPGGPFASAGALHIEGNGFTEWGSGFGSVFASDPTGACLFSAAAYSGISFWIKGSIEPDGSIDPWDPGVLRVMLVEKDVVPLPAGNCNDELGDCWSSHRVRIELDDCWRRHSFTFDEFVPDDWGIPGGPLDLDELYELAFELGRGNRYDIWLDDLEFFVGEKPSAESSCEPGPGGSGNF